MIDLKKLKRKASNTELMATRVKTETKQWFDAFCLNEGLTISAVLGELAESFKKEQENKVNKSA